MEHTTTLTEGVKPPDMNTSNLLDTSLESQQCTGNDFQNDSTVIQHDSDSNMQIVTLSETVKLVSTWKSMKARSNNNHKCSNEKRSLYDNVDSKCGGTFSPSETIRIPHESPASPSLSSPTSSTMICSDASSTTACNGDQEASDTSHEPIGSPVKRQRKFDPEAVSGQEITVVSDTDLEHSHPTLSSVPPSPDASVHTPALRSSRRRLPKQSEQTPAKNDQPPLTNDADTPAIVVPVIVPAPVAPGPAAVPAPVAPGPAIVPAAVPASAAAPGPAIVPVPEASDGEDIFELLRKDHGLCDAVAEYCDSALGEFFM